MTYSSPGRYGGAEAQADDREPFEEKVKRLVKTFREQQAEAACLRRHYGRQAKLDAAIEANLKELGYGW